MEGLQTVYDVSNNGHYGWGSGWGAGVGGFLGAAIGNGNGLFGNRNASGVVADTALLDAVNGVANSVNAANTANIQGQAALQNASNQGFSGVNTSILTTSMGLQNSTNQGFAGLNTAITTGDAGIQNALCQGFSGVNTAVLTSSRDIIQSQKDCCCELGKEIIKQGCETRELINATYTRSLETQLCDAKAKIGALESNAFTAANNAAQTQVLLAHLGK